MCVPINTTSPAFTAVIAGIFALAGGLFGSLIAKQTEYNKWLRQERSSAFTAYYRQVQKFQHKSINAIYSNDLTIQERELKISKLYSRLSSQENIIRLYLSKKDRHIFSTLAHDLFVHSSSHTSQSLRLNKNKEFLLKLRFIFEETL